MTITLYDIPSSSPNYGVSPMTWRIRYCLGIKKIPFKTEWIEYPDIKPLYLRLGITPTARKSDGSAPHYTLPVIYDPSTNKYIPDSFAIAQYLEDRYPETTPSIFPHSTVALHLAFTEGLWGVIAPIMKLMTWNIFISLNPASVEYYREAREASLGMKMEELVGGSTGDSDVTQRETVRAVLAKFEAYYAKNGGNSGPFVMGDVPSWADVVVGGLLAILRLGWGEDSDKWKETVGCPNGRWAVFVEGMKEYEITN